MKHGKPQGEPFLERFRSPIVEDESLVAAGSSLLTDSKSITVRAAFGAARPPGGEPLFSPLNGGGGGTTVICNRLSLVDTPRSGRLILAARTRRP